LPATALAAGETLTVSPANSQAGGTTNVSATLTFDAADTPKTVVTSLAPGMLGNLNANPTCLVGSPQLTPSCSIGNAVTHTNGGDIPATLYLVPPAPGSSDAAAIEAVSPVPGVQNQIIDVALNPKVPGSLNLTTTFPQPPSPGQITGFTANFTTLNGQEFTRLPSSCATATSTFSVTYYGATAPSSGAGGFTPTGCNNLPYAPKLSAAITRDAHDNGAALVTEVTQAANESASKSIVLQFPKGLQPNVQADLPCLSGAGCTVGTASATSPLVPSAALANGKVTLSGPATTPNISIAFPAPFGITITGTVSLTSNSVTFANVPDVPLTDLKLNITGPSSTQKAFTTDCAPASIGGTFTPQSGTPTVSVTAPITFTSCQLPPTATGSTGGLGKGHPKLKFTITHGQGAPNVTTVVIGLPGGLKFSRSAIVSHKTCTRAAKGKKPKCSTTTLIKGLGIRGGKAKSVAIKHGRLVITLKKASSRVTFTLSGVLVSESKGLQTKVKKHRTKDLRFTLKVTDANQTATTLSLKLKAH
jgi:hypothetical protein